MNVILGIYYAAFIALVAWAVWSAFNGLMARISPKWAAKRKLRDKRSADKRYAKRHKRTAKLAEREQKRTERELSWAKANPDDPAAKLILADETSPESVRTEALLKEPDDFLAELRRKQKSDDDYQRQLEARRIAEEVRAQQLLDWAIENPVIPEARRHLEEQLEENAKLVERSDGEIRHCKTMMSYKKDDDPESILYGMRRAEAVAKKNVDLERLRRIQSALEAPVPQSSE